MKTFRLLLIIILAGVVVSACNTISGFGEDIKQASGAVQRKLK